MQMENRLVDYIIAFLFFITTFAAFSINLILGITTMLLAIVALFSTFNMK